jgi:hypothetical protein
LSNALLYPNQQVNKLFAAEGEETLSAVVHEGCIYNIRDDMQKNPYKSIDVIWMEQEKDTLQWYYAYSQTDTAVSPWELNISSFAPLKGSKPIAVPKTLLVGKIYAKSILDYIRTWDMAKPFKEPLSICKDQEYCSLFSVEDRLDLQTINTWGRSGRYEEEIGIAVLFDDLERMVANSKKLNAANAQFLPWIQADAMGKMLFQLKKCLAAKTKNETLQNSVEDHIELVNSSQSRLIGEDV